MVITSATNYLEIDGEVIRKDQIISIKPIKTTAVEMKLTDQTFRRLKVADITSPDVANATELMAALKSYL
jgi:hypothetical protein